MNKENLYIVIMAGGQGTRLWPLSRKKLPKQLLPFHGKSTLLDLTVDRIGSLAEPSHRWVITTEEYKKAIQRQLGEKIGTVLAEPSTRNTGPAILFTCLEIYKHDPDASIIFLPADHFIENDELFIKNIAEAVEFAAQHNTIALLGLKPTHPATGYGYIEYTPSDKKSLYAIRQFHEKPNESTAEKYIQNPSMLWNIGIFCGTAKNFLHQFEKYAPQLNNEVHEFMDNKRSYNEIESISIDHALMEKSDNINVLPVEFDWSDVGNLETFLELQKDNRAQIVSLNSNNYQAYASQPNKIITLLGVDNICVVDTPDALLITRKDNVEDVKLLQEALKKLELENYL